MENDTRPDLSLRSASREYRIGTRFIGWNGEIHKYAKVDFGIISHSVSGRAVRDIQYMWIQVK